MIIPNNLALPKFPVLPNFLYDIIPGNNLVLTGNLPLKKSVLRLNTFYSHL